MVRATNRKRAGCRSESRSGLRFFFSPILTFLLRFIRDVIKICRASLSLVTPASREGAGGGGTSVHGPETPGAGFSRVRRASLLGECGRILKIQPHRGKGGALVDPWLSLPHPPFPTSLKGISLVTRKIRIFTVEHAIPRSNRGNPTSGKSQHLEIK